MKKKDTNTKSITSDKDINEALMNISKKTKNTNKKTLINDFISKKEDLKKKVPKKELSQNAGINDNVINEVDEINEENTNGKTTFTSKLSDEDIVQKLIDYKKVDDITTVPIGTHLRYFIKKDNEYLFRMGGNLKRNLDLPKFIILKNAKDVEWSVQTENTVFYKKMSIKEIKEEYENIINDLHGKIKKLKLRVKELENKK